MRDRLRGQDPTFIAAAQQLADTVAAGGSVDEHKDRIDDFKVTLKENIEVGRVERVEVADGPDASTPTSTSRTVAA